MKKYTSPLRYPGGKSRAIQAILAHVPANITEFREPFVGGGSVYLAMRGLFGSNIRHYWINDIYQDLVCFWRATQGDIDRLVQAVSFYKRTYPDGRALYQTLKHPQQPLTEFDRAVRFFIMNRITFSGVMDAGGYSQQAFEKRFTESSIQRLRNVAPALLGTHITQADYQALLTQKGQQVFIFLDPPYWSATQSRLYGKRGELHVGFDHERLSQQLRECEHRWLMTYDDSPYIRELYSFAHISEWQLQYGMNNYKQASAAKGHELFICSHALR